MSQAQLLPTAPFVLFRALIYSQCNLFHLLFGWFGPIHSIWFTYLPAVEVAEDPVAFCTTHLSALATTKKQTQTTRIMKPVQIYQLVPKGLWEQDDSGQCRLCQSRLSVLAFARYALR